MTAFEDAFSSVHIPPTIMTDNEVKISIKDVPEVQTAIPQLLSIQVHGTPTPTPTTLYHGPTLRGEFGIICGGDHYSSDENEENRSLVDDSNIAFGSPDMYQV